jgi:hypothetical protein
MRRRLLAVAGVWLAGCTRVPAPAVDSVESAEQQLFDGFPKGADSIAILCEPPVGADAVSRAFCGATVPRLTSLRDLQTVLGLGLSGSPAPSLALVGHSSSLVARNVSAINPRALLFTPNVTSPLTPYVSLGYTRGEEFAEIATTDAVTHGLNFYVVKFEHACDFDGGCSYADLLTPSVETNWVRFSVYEDDPFFKDTILDCRQCHQPRGATPILRMQENSAPFTHFFSTSTAGGQALFADYYGAHASTEDYAGIPANLLSKSDPAALAAFVSGAGFGAQPNAFDSAAIEAEVEASSPGQPADNSVPGVSATWSALFANFVQGLDIPPPYHDVKISDPSLLAAMSAAYRAVMAGTADPGSLPDIRQVLPDSAQALSEMGFRAKPGSSGPELVVNACVQCHNPNLDQTVSRALFDAANLPAMSPAEKQKAIGRILMPPDNLLLMPPARFRSLTEDEKASVVELLSE